MWPMSEGVGAYVPTENGTRPVRVPVRVPLLASYALPSRPVCVPYASRTRPVRVPGVCVPYASHAPCTRPVRVPYASRVRVPVCASISEEPAIDATDPSKVS